MPPAWSPLPQPSPPGPEGASPPWRRRRAAAQTWAIDHLSPLLLAIPRLRVGPLVAAFVVVWLLGAVAFKVAGPQRSWSDALYLALLLFDKEGVATEQVPPLLDLARFAAWVLAAGVVLRVVSSLFQEQIDRWRASQCEGHVILCGLGWRGTALAASLREQRTPVVAIDPRELTDEAARLDLVALQGDAADPELLLRAGLTRASHLVVLAGEDDRNADVAVAAAAALAGHGRVADGTVRPLHCLVHIASPILSRSLLPARLAGLGGAALECTFFNLQRRAADLILAEHPVIRPLDHHHPGGRLTPRIFIGGDGELAENLAAAVAEAWQARLAAQAAVSATRAARYPAHAYPVDHRLPVTVCGDGAAAAVERWQALHPALAAACEVEAWGFDQLVALAERGAAPQPPFTTAYLGPEDDGVAMSMALLLQRLLAPDDAAVSRPVRPPIVACLATEGGLWTLIRATAQTPDPPRHLTALQPELHVFPVHLRTCHADLVAGDSEEAIARQYYDSYHAASGPAAPRWEDLPPGDFNRESTLRMARFVAVRLRHAGYRLECCGAATADLPSPLTTGDLTTLAALEHLRWMAERLLFQGWEQAAHDLPADREGRAHQDRAARLSRIMVPWHELDEAVREQNLTDARQLRDQLRAAGYRLVRLAQPTPRPAWLRTECYGADETEAGRR